MVERAAYSRNVARLQKALSECVDELRCCIGLLEVIADNDPNTTIADNGMTVWDGIHHDAAWRKTRIERCLTAALGGWK